MTNEEIIAELKRYLSELSLQKEQTSELILTLGLGVTGAEILQAMERREDAINAAVERIKLNKQMERDLHGLCEFCKRSRREHGIPMCEVGGCCGGGNGWHKKDLWEYRGVVEGKHNSTGVGMFADGILQAIDEAKAETEARGNSPTEPAGNL